MVCTCQLRCGASGVFVLLRTRLPVARHVTCTSLASSKMGRMKSHKQMLVPDGAPYGFNSVLTT